MRRRQCIGSGSAAPSARTAPGIRSVLPRRGERRESFIGVDGCADGRCGDTGPIGVSLSTGAGAVCVSGGNGIGAAAPPGNSISTARNAG